MFKVKNFVYLGIICCSAALVALGVQEFKVKHDQQLSTIEVENVQRMLRNFRGVNDFERASFSAAQYQEIKNAQSPVEPKDSFKDNLNSIKSRLKKIVQIIKSDSPEDKK